MGKCIFCDFVGKLTHEHIRPDWLKGYLPKTKVNYEAGNVIVNRHGMPDKVASKTVGGDPLSRRVKCVCEECNTGWMKDLQDAAKPIVVPMLTGERVVLNRRDQRTLASWISMSVMCSERGKDQMPAISQDDRDILFEYRLPPKANWRIWLGHYRPDRSPTQWDHRALLISKAKEVDQAAFAASPTYNTQSTTYSVGELFIHAVSSDWPTCVRKYKIFPRGLLVELWPPNGTPVIWPPDHILTDDEAHQIAAGFFDGLRRAGTPRSAR